MLILPSGLLVAEFEEPSSEPAGEGTLAPGPWDKPSPSCSANSAWSRIEKQSKQVSGEQSSHIILPAYVIFNATQPGRENLHAEQGKEKLKINLPPWWM